jgi:hypothetical protein
MYEGHPPFNHNPHVYDFVDPGGNPGTGMVVHSDVAVNTPDGPEAVDVEQPDQEPAATPESEEDGPGDVDGDGVIDEYEAHTKVELVELCAARTPPLSTTGNKAELVARLREADQAAQASE